MGLQGAGQNQLDPALLTATPQLQLAQSLMQQGTETSPIRSPWQGVARLAQVLAGQHLQGQAVQGLSGLYGGAAQGAAATLPDGDPVKTALLSNDPMTRMKGLQAYQAHLVQLGEPRVVGPNAQVAVPGAGPLASNTNPTTDIGKLQADLAKVPPGSPEALAIQAQIQKINSIEPGVQLTGHGNATQIPGAAPAIANVAGAKTGAETAAAAPFKEGGTVTINGKEYPITEQMLNALQPHIPGLNAAGPQAGSPPAVPAASPLPNGAPQTAMPQVAPVPNAPPAPPPLDIGRVAPNPIAQPMVDANTKQFGTIMDQAAIAREEQQKAQLLKQQLAKIGSTGTLTDFMGGLSRLGQQLGVPQEVLDKFNIPNGATIEQAGKLKTDLLGEVLKAQFPQRITNNDIKLFQNTVPGPDMRPESNAFLLDNVIMPKTQRDIDRGGAIVDLPQKDPTLGSLPRALYDFDTHKSLSSYTPQLNSETKATSGVVPPGVTREMIEKRLKELGVAIPGQK